MLHKSNLRTLQEFFKGTSKRTQHRGPDDFEWTGYRGSEFSVTIYLIIGSGVALCVRVCVYSQFTTVRLIFALKTSFICCNLKRAMFRTLYSIPYHNRAMKPTPNQVSDYCFSSTPPHLICRQVRVSSKLIIWKLC